MQRLENIKLIKRNGSVRNRKVGYIVGPKVKYASICIANYAKRL